MGEILPIKSEVSFSSNGGPGLCTESTDCTFAWLTSASKLGEMLGEFWDQFSRLREKLGDLEAGSIFAWLNASKKSASKFSEMLGEFWERLGEKLGDLEAGRQVLRLGDQLGVKLGEKLGELWEFWSLLLSQKVGEFGVRFCSRDSFPEDWSACKF